MLNFNSETEMLTHFETSVPGYIKGTLKATGSDFNGYVAEDGSQVYSGMRQYLQTVGTGAFKQRECYVESRFDGSMGVLFPSVSETEDGIAKVVSSFSGPNEYFPWVFSIWGHMARDGAAANLPKVRSDGTAAQEGDLDTDLFYKYSFSETLAYEIGFQNIVACWARFNEGDCADVFVDIPGSWAAAAAQAAGADAQTVAYLNSLAWYQHAQFGEDITMFGTNERGTHYPPTQSPAMSWILAGARIRVDVYKKVIDDYQYRLLEGETELTHPAKRGPFLDLDILCQRKR